MIFFKKGIIYLENIRVIILKYVYKGERENFVIFDLSRLKIEYLNYWVYVMEYFLVKKIWVYLDFIWY